MKEERKQIKSAHIINIVECDGATCVSVGDNDSRYYASPKYKKQLTTNRYKR